MSGLLGHIGMLMGGAAPPPPSPILLSITPTLFPADTNAHNVAMPATVLAGDLLLVFTTTRSSGATANVTTPGGWTQVFADIAISGGTTYCHCFYKVATGTEGGTTVNFNTGVGATHAATQCWRFQSGSYSGAPTASTLFATSSMTVDPPSHASGWAGQDVFWIAGFGSNGTASPTAWPYVDNQTVSASGGTNVCRIIACTTISSAGTLNPPAFTMAASTNSASFTLSIRPA